MMTMPLAMPDLPIVFPGVHDDCLICREHLNTDGECLGYEGGQARPACWQPAEDSSGSIDQAGDLLDVESTDEQQGSTNCTNNTDDTCNTDDTNNADRRKPPSAVSPGRDAVAERGLSDRTAPRSTPGPADASPRVGPAPSFPCDPEPRDGPTGEAEADGRDERTPHPLNPPVMATPSAPPATFPEARQYRRIVFDSCHRIRE